MLNILHARCQSLGVAIEYHKDITDLEEVSGSDLIIVCDGVNSTIRRNYPSYFEPELSSRSNKYIWFGTHQLFHALTLTFRENEAGVFASHSYKFDKTTSTFVVECDPDTWENAGFASMTEDETRIYLEKVFEKDLGGNPLLSNRSLWINFLLVKNKHWVHENIVILGCCTYGAFFYRQRNEACSRRCDSALQRTGRYAPWRVSTGCAKKLRIQPQAQGRRVSAICL